MTSRKLLLLALGATASMSAAAPAIAGPYCVAPCVPHVVIVQPAEPLYVKPFFVVDQGPVYSGPSIVTWPRTKEFHVPAANYPYVTHVYYYPARRHGRYPAYK